MPLLRTGVESGSCLPTRHRRALSLKSHRTLPGPVLVRGPPKPRACRGPGRMHRQPRHPVPIPRLRTSPIRSLSSSMSPPSRVPRADQLTIRRRWVRALIYKKINRVRLGEGKISCVWTRGTTDFNADMKKRIFEILKMLDASGVFARHKWTGEGAKMMQKWRLGTFHPARYDADNHRYARMRSWECAHLHPC